MGRQINFYMHAHDEAEFLDVVRRSGNLQILPGRSRTETFTAYEVLPDRSQLGWFQLWLWNETVCKPPVLRWVKEQQHYVIDGTASEAIEFSRSYEREDGRLVRGRLWAEMKGWRMDNPAATFDKSAAFRKWYDRLAAWLRKHYDLNAAGDYVGPGAAAHQRSGARLIQLNTADVVKLVSH